MALANIHSAVVFDQHAKDCGLTTLERITIEGKAWNTQSAFANNLRLNYEESKMEEFTATIAGGVDIRLIKDRISSVRSLWVE